MSIRFVKELDTGLVLGQYAGEGFEAVIEKGETKARKVVYYFHHNGEKGWILASNVKIFGGFRHHTYFK
jgi:hypothetical protein